MVRLLVILVLYQLSWIETFLTRVKTHANHRSHFYGCLLLVQKVGEDKLDLLLSKETSPSMIAITILSLDSERLGDVARMFYTMLDTLCLTASLTDKEKADLLAKRRRRWLKLVNSSLKYLFPILSNLWYNTYHRVEGLFYVCGWLG